MSETLRDALDDIRAAIDMRELVGAEETLSHLYSVLPGALLDVRLDCPVVRCGEDSVVLAVDREELAADIEDGVEVYYDEAGHITHVTYDADAILNAILALLDFREVERIVPIKHGKKMWEAGSLPGGYCEVALLKPKSAQADKEGE